jgi:cyclophilin family peptidyl-prolyl cis-trans isomerase
MEVLVLCFALVLQANAQTPSIISQPQSTTNNNASAADFAVVATNAATYQWCFQGANIPGATNATLSLDDLSTNQAGSYTVVVTSSNNLAVTSTPPAVLTIVPGTIIQWTLSSYPNGSSSNFLVQLFDHDKPATVQNFIHYITSGAYSNMFLDRDVANFVLQGGDYVSLDRTTNGLNVTTNLPMGTNIFPSQVDSEFNVGPLIHNYYGTLAMALKGTNQNSATSSFYFNSTNNATYLDNLYGGFTVFGRILYGTNSGSNVLHYFNSLSAPANGIFDYSSSNLSISTLPVNYDGTNEPTDANLFYCSFAFISPTNPPVDTTPPTVAITFPTSNAAFTNFSTVTVTGTASDNVGLAEVFCVLTALTGVSQGQSQTNVALGTTNWSVNLGYPAAGLYQLTAYAQDGAGNLSAPATENFTAMIPPGILAQPTNVTYLVGSSAEISITAGNAMSYQWQLAGTGPITNATNATLVLSDVSTNQSGSSYDVVVTAPDGLMVTSAPVVLTVVTGTLVQIAFAGFPEGLSNTVIVQLFDYQKPATVANFLHYLTPASLLNGFEYNQPFANMVWDRCIPGFILQGGDYDAPDETNGIPPQNLASTLESIASDFTDISYYTPPFAGQVDNEFGVGPVLSNTFGTLAMAKIAGDPDSASSAFFFNLADNSASLDNQNGGFTVFGRLLPGDNYLQYSNVLQYFNTLSKPNQGIFDSTMVGTNESLPDLPVNYHGWGLPADSNLFFANFTLLSAFNADTNPPTVSVNSPTNGQTMTSNDVLVQGTASDNVGVANVACYCEGPFNFSTAVYAIGTTNWTADLGILAPGEYTIIVLAQDGAGNYSTAATSTLVVPLFPFQVTVTGPGTLSTNLNNSNTVEGGIYQIKATPDKGALFVNWASGPNAYNNPKLTFRMENGLPLTANFISNTAPRGISVTSPSPGERLTNGNFSIEGKVAVGFDLSNITCQVFSASSSNSVSAPMLLDAANISASNTWLTPSLSLDPGNYVLQAVAVSTDGRAAFISRQFVILAPLSVTIYGPGRATIPNGAYFEVGTSHTIVAEPAPGQKFLSWNAGGGAFPVPSLSFPMSAGLALTATFVSNDLPGKLTITSPPAGEVTTPHFTLTGKITATDTPLVVCQLFHGSTPVTGFLPTTMTGAAWQLAVTTVTNMGRYTAVAIATDASGQTTLAEKEFVVNYFPSIAGSYHGLFFDTNLLFETNAGYISFKLTSSGLVEGNLSFPARNYPLAFAMGYLSSGTVRPDAALNPALYLTVTFDVSNLSGIVTGFVTQGSEACPLTAYRAASELSASTAPAPGHYVLSLEPGGITGPPDDGFAALNVAADGNLAVAGLMADDTPFSQATGVFTNGVWPLYASFYKGHGMLIGWETNLASGAIAGSLYWIKSPANGQYYTNGVNEQINSVGTNYLRPTPGAPYQIVFGGGALASSFGTNYFSFKADGTVVPAPGTTDKLSGSLVMSTGVLKGSISNPTNTQTLDFRGVLFSPSEGGSGFTLEAGSQTGSFQITPVEIATPARE